MLRAQKSTLIAILTGLVMLACLLPLPGSRSEANAAELPTFAVDPSIAPAFGWDRSDYVVRCDGNPVKITVSSPEGWLARISEGNPRAGDFELLRALKPGRSFTIGFNHQGKRIRTFHVRCLPTDFPAYRIEGAWAGAPRLTLVQLTERYAVAFDQHGAPVWWQKVPEGAPVDLKFLPDSTVAYAPVEGISFRRIIIRSLDGHRLRTLTAGDGLDTDLHDLQLTPNGNYLLGSHRYTTVDTSRFGGSDSASIGTAQLQEITKTGQIVWRWNAYPRIKLSETGRWWPNVISSTYPYDVHHWNSIDRRGRLILLSFRHLDAIYCIDRRSGRILWKLGGTKTPKQLRVVSDPRGRYPLGGQHDARFGPNGTISVFDNATNLKRSQPRAVRYRINWKRRTATMIGQVVDSRIGLSVGYGSARIDQSGNWQIDWGVYSAKGLIGNYDSKGRVLSRLALPAGPSYRANGVYGKSPSINRLRKAMNRMAARAN